MRTKAILLFCALAFAGRAQTNMVFDRLLSPANVVVMTNAEFRTFSGNQIIFKNGEGYKNFHAGDLNTNVLARLNITAEQLEARQKAIDATNREHYENAGRQQAEYLRKQAWLKTAATNDIPGWNGGADNGSRKSWDGKHYHDNQSGGNFIGN